MGKWAITLAEYDEATREHARCRAGSPCVHVLDTYRHCSVDGEAWPCLTRRLMRERDTARLFISGLTDRLDRARDELDTVSDAWHRCDAERVPMRREIEVLTATRKALRTDIAARDRAIKRMRAAISGMSEDLDMLNEMNHRLSKRVGRLTRRVARAKEQRELEREARIGALTTMAEAVEDARVLGEAVREYVAWMRDDTATRSASQIEARLDALLAATGHRMEDRP